MFDLSVQMSDMPAMVLISPGLVSHLTLQASSSPMQAPGAGRRLCRILQSKPTACMALGVPPSPSPKEKDVTYMARNFWSNQDRDILETTPWLDGLPSIMKLLLLAATLSALRPSAAIT